ncbi:MAG: pseudouridine synthase [Rhodoplanes sp.]
MADSLPPPRHKRSIDEVFTEPQRLHKVLAACGFGSRRSMEELILAGRITVNREPADVGQKVGPGDEVRINGELVKVRFAEPRPRILMSHKPTGELVTRDDPEGRPTVFEQLPNIGNGKWIAIGRLDYNTEGLLLFTNAGELANKMMHPRYEVEREYAVRVMGTLSEEQQKALLTGIELEDGPAKVEKLDDGGGEGANHWYHVTLKEGRNREVRRLFEKLDLMVSRLIRTRYGSVAMPARLKRGQTLELEPHEVNAVLAAAGMKPAASGRPGQPPPPSKPGQSKPHPGHGKPRHQRGPNSGPMAPREMSDDAAPRDEGIEPGNSVHGLPTHANRSVGSFFGKGPGKSHRPYGQGGGPRHSGGQGYGGGQRAGTGQGYSGGPRAGGGQGYGGGPRAGGGQGYRGGQGEGQGYGGGQGQGHGGGQGHGHGGGQGQGGGQGRPQHGKPRKGGPGAGSRGPASPYVMTTLTIPGAVPEGLPGTNAPRPKAPAGQGQPGGPNKKRSRGNRNRHGGPQSAQPAQEDVGPPKEHVFVDEE